MLMTTTLTTMVTDRDSSVSENQGHPDQGPQVFLLVQCFIWNIPLFSTERFFFRPCLALFPPVAPRAWFRPFPGFQFDLPPRFQIDPAPRLQIKFVSFIVFPVLMFSCGGLSLYFPLCFLPCPPLPFLTFPLRTFPTARVSNQPCARFQIDPAPRLQGKRQPGGDELNDLENPVTLLLLSIFSEGSCCRLV